ncbi:MAG: hypothetical protein NTZ78_15195 [Candidatus Aureabacteria bacterium]|nr:hypothetical protein [Candidatus Auribacterota bacterium]
MKMLMTVVLGLMFAVGMAGMAIAGSLDSPGDPSAGSEMYSLSQLYDYLNSGIKATPVPGFQEPNTAPGATMMTTKQIYDDFLAKSDLCDVTVAEVKLGKKYFSTMAGSWGVRTGTLTSYPSIPVNWSGNCIWRAGDQTCPDNYPNKRMERTCTTSLCTCLGGGASATCNRCDGAGTMSGSCSGQGCSTTYGSQKCGLFPTVNNTAGSGSCISSETTTYCCQSGA